MTLEVAVIGDIHGNSAALRGMLGLLADWTGLIVFSGDYVNRGPDSAGVLQILSDLSETRRGTFFIAGNHDVAFRAALNSGNLFPLLSVGGASTIKSYIGDATGDVAQQLEKLVPASHRIFLDRLLPYFSHDLLIVTHRKNDIVEQVSSDSYRVSGHTPTPDAVPKIGADSAAIDTGCGASPVGRLSCFFWPSRTYKQVDARGAVIGSNED